MKIYRIAQEQIEGKKEENSEDIICPFCHIENFDLIGLKSHLLRGDCEIFNETDLITRKF